MNIMDIDLSNFVEISDEKNPLFNMDKETVVSLLTDYSKKLPNKKILEKYNLPNTYNNKLKSLLPLIISSEICEFDKSNMLMVMPSKSDLNNFCPQLSCPICDHQINKKSGWGQTIECTCANCEKKKEVEINRVREIVKASQPKEKIEPWMISFENRISLACILQISGVEYGQLIPPYDRYSTSTTSISLEILEQLFKDDIIIISELSDHSAFNEVNQNSFRYNPTRVQYKLNINFEEEYENNALGFEDMKHPTTIFLNTDDKVYYWKQYIVSELLYLFRKRMETYRFINELSNEKKMKKIEDSIIRWLEVFIPSQIYSLIYLAIRYADNKRTEGKMGNYRYNEIAFIIKIIDQKITQYEQQGWTIEAYQYPSIYEPQMQTLVYFNTILKESNWFNLSLPKVNLNEHFEDKSILIKSKQYAMAIEPYESQEISSFMKKAIDNAIYYAITREGLLIGGASVDCLFGTHLDFAKNVDNKNSLSNNISIYVSEVVSSEILYKAISVLIQSVTPTFNEWRKRIEEINDEKNE